MKKLKYENPLTDVKNRLGKTIDKIFGKKLRKPVSERRCEVTSKG